MHTKTYYSASTKMMIFVLALIFTEEDDTNAVEANLTLKVLVWFGLVRNQYDNNLQEQRISQSSTHLLF